MKQNLIITILLVLIALCSLYDFGVEAQTFQGLDPLIMQQDVLGLPPKANVGGQAGRQCKLDAITKVFSTFSGKQAHLQTRQVGTQLLIDSKSLAASVMIDLACTTSKCGTPSPRPFGYVVEMGKETITVDLKSTWSRLLLEQGMSKVKPALNIVKCISWPPGTTLPTTATGVVKLSSGTVRILSNTDVIITPFDSTAPVLRLTLAKQGQAWVGITSTISWTGHDSRGLC